jgi:hypothetical protein
LDSRRLGDGVSLMVDRLKLGGRDVAAGPVEPLGIPPGNPGRGRELDLVDRAPGTLSPDELGLVQPVRSGQPQARCPVRFSPLPVGREEKSLRHGRIVEQRHRLAESYAPPGIEDVTPVERVRA